jgi:hypothetical protein
MEVWKWKKARKLHKMGKDCPCVRPLVIWHPFVVVGGEKDNLRTDRQIEK